MTETADPSPNGEQVAALETMLPLVPMHGWTQRALAEGLRDAGRDSSEAEWRFPGGAPEMIALFFDQALSRATAVAASQVASEIRQSKRVRALVSSLLSELGPHKDAVRRALAWLILPINARRSALILARLVNGIWDAAGDQSEDASRYTKRATLAAFDRRLQGVARIGRFRARMQTGCRSVMGRSIRPSARAAA
jgi:ubiquinone biosynthesis protein COQ9